MRKETILKKALHEAMTEKYSKELTDAKAPDHEFSESFNIKMRNLIRKTDNPFYRYSKYLTLAACGVIAVGCAVIIPVLNSNKIHTGILPDEHIAETGAVTSASTKAPEIAEDEIIVTIITDKEEISENPEQEPEDVPETETGTAASDDDEAFDTADNIKDNDGDEAEEKSEDSEYEPIGGDDIDEADENPGQGVDNPTTGPDTDTDSEIDIIDDEAEDEEDIDGEVVDNDGDYDVIDEEEEDCDEDIAIDEVVEDESDEDVDEGDNIDYVDERPDYPEAETLGELYTKLYKQDLNPEYVKKNSYAVENANYFGLRYDTVRNNDIYVDYDFVKEFLGEIKTAKRTETISSEKDHATIWLNPVAVSSTAPTYMDSGDVNRYDAIYHGGDDYEDCDDEEDAEEGPCSVKLEIYRTGLICLTFDWNKGSLWFAASAETAGKFFENVDNMFMDELPAALGDVITDRNITEDNICRAYGNVYNVYDYHITGINLNDSKSVIVDFLKENKDKKLTYCEYTDNSNNSGLKIRFGLKDNSSVIELQIIDFNKAVIRVSGGNSYAFDIDKAQFNGLFKKLVGVCGYKNPVIYNTMAEFIKDKDFNEITSISYSIGSDRYIVEGVEKAAVLEEIRQLILKEAETAEYGIGDYVYANIAIYAQNWQPCFEISGDEAVRIRNNRFQVSKSFIEKIQKLIEENGVEISYDDEGETDPEEEWTEDIDEE